MRALNLFLLVAFIFISSCKKPPKVKAVDVNIVAMALSDGTLSPNYVPATNSYSSSVNGGVSSVSVIITTSSTDAVVKVNGAAVVSGTPSPGIPLAVGSNVITVILSSKDGFTNRTYTIALTRAPAPVADSLTYIHAHGAWVAYKDSVHNSYSYTAEYVSAFGFGSDITTGVKNGVIISRDFIRWSDTSGTHKRVTDKAWHEESTTINSHGGEGGDPMTLDDVYTKAFTVWLVADPAKNTIYLEAKNHGLLSLCGYVPNGCQDDCFIGIHIISITPL